MDILFIKELRLETEIGVYEWEHNIKQPISVDIEVNTVIGQAAKTDDIQYALDYKVITDEVTALITSKHFKLVESVAESVAELLQVKFGVTWLRVSVSKLSAIKSAKAVGVVIERGERT